MQWTLGRSGAAVVGVLAVATLTGTAARQPAPAGAAVTTTVAGCPSPIAGVGHYAPGSGKTVALTFDDGPGGRSTGDYLRILRAEGVRATFFDLGQLDAAHPGLVRAEQADGHAIGNHSWNHDRLTRLTPAGQASQIDRTSAVQTDITGSRPCLFRPPYGAYNDTTLSLAHARGMSVYNWSVDPEDWRAAGILSTYWVDRITRAAEAGASLNHPLMLFHDEPAGNPSTAAALPTVIDFYRARGYRFVDLLGRSGVTPSAPTGVPTVGLAYTRSGLHVVRLGSGGHLDEKTRHDGVWGGWHSLGGSVTGSPAALATGPTTMLVFARGTDGHLHVRRVEDDGAGGWADRGGSVALRPAATVSADGTVTVAVTGPAGGVSVRQRVGGEWRSWTSLGGSYATGPAIAAARGGALTVVAATRDGALWRRFRPAGSTAWGAWTRMTGTSTAHPSLVPLSGGRLLLAVRGIDGAMYARVRSATFTWGGWRRLGGDFAAAPAMAPRGGDIDLLALGLDGRGRLVTASVDATSVSWGSWHTVPVP